MEDDKNDNVVADSEDEEGFQSHANQSGLLSGNPFSTGPANISEPSVIQPATFTVSPVRTPRGSPNISTESLFTPPPEDKEPEIFSASPLLPPTAESSAPKSKPRPRPIPRKPRTTDSVIDEFTNEDVSRSSGSRINSASAFSASTLFGDPICPPTTSSIVNSASEPNEVIIPTLSIADRAKMRSRKTQAEKPARVPVDVAVIELTSDSDVDELSLKPSRKRHKPQGEPVKPRPKPKPKFRKLPSPMNVEPDTAGTHSSETAAPPAPQEHPFPSQPPSTVSHLPSSSIAPVPDVSSPPSSLPSSPPPVITRKRKRAPPPEPETHAEEMDTDIVNGSLTSNPEPPLFFAPSLSVPPIDKTRICEGKPRNTDATAIVSKDNKRKSTKLSTKAKGKKGRKQVGELELDELVQKSSPDKETAGNDNFVGDDFIGEETQKVASKKRAPPKPKGKSKAKGKGKGKGNVILSESEDGEDGSLRSKSPARCSELPEGPQSSSASPQREPRVIEDTRTSENLLQAVRAPPQQIPSASHLRSRTVTTKPKSTPMSELIRRVNSHPSSPFANAPSYSPLLKSSRTMLSRIAPLHPNRRTPPPPLPRPPPPKKSKKQIEMEERIEEELSETVEGWSCMTDEERRCLRRARIDAELGYE